MTPEHSQARCQNQLGVLTNLKRQTCSAWLRCSLITEAPEKRSSNTGHLREGCHSPSWQPSANSYKMVVRVWRPHGGRRGSSRPPFVGREGAARSRDLWPKVPELKLSWRRISWGGAPYPLLRQHNNGISSDSTDFLYESN